jgi:hypothetical protein
MNSLIYDPCAYRQSLAESTSPLAYMLDTSRYRRDDMCRPQLGIVGGTAVSHVKGNLVDLENNLFGIDRPGIQCAAYMHRPPSSGQDALKVRGAGYLYKPCPPEVDTTLLHLPSCQFSSYPSVPMPSTGLGAYSSVSTACPRK